MSLGEKSGELAGLGPAACAEVEDGLWRDVAHDRGNGSAGGGVLHDEVGVFAEEAPEFGGVPDEESVVGRAMSCEGGVLGE